VLHPASSLIGHAGEARGGRLWHRSSGCKGMVRDTTRAQHDFDLDAAIQALAERIGVTT